MALLRTGPGAGEVRAREATVRACGHAVCLRLHKSDFDRVLAPLAALRDEMAARRADNSTREEERFRFHDLELGSVLGVGSFGYVRLALHRDGAGKERVLALKAMRKDHLVKKRQVQHVLNERWVGQALQHPFLCTLLSTYQDDAHLYMLTEALMGGELFSLLCAYETLEATTARFYLAQVACK